jgi:flagellar FliL protein
MADNKEKTEDNDEKTEAEEGGKKKFKLPTLSPKAKLIVVIVAGLLFLGGVVGGTLYALGVFGDSEEEVVEEVVVEEVEQKDLKPPAMYFPIKPAFIVNFQSRGRQRFLQVEVSVMTREQDVFSALQQHLPLVKNKLVMLFSGEVYEELQTNEGRELMRQKALEAVQSILQQEIGKPGIEQVLFTNFVMQ